MQCVCWGFDVALSLTAEGPKGRLVAPFIRAKPETRWQSTGLHTWLSPYLLCGHSTWPKDPPV
jgi:hypothetical protein